MKTLASVRKLTNTDGADVITENVYAFNSDLEFETYLASKAAADVVEAKILTTEEVEKYLAPFKAEVVDADRRKAEAKKILEDCAAANQALFNITGEGYSFQDPFDGCVYKTARRDGKFVYFETVEIKRTRREGEAKGSLSMKEAKEAGFTLSENK